MSDKRVSWPIVWLGIFWWYIETSYFGWNATPSCIEELIADGAALAFFALAFAAPNLSRTTRIQIVSKITEDSP